MNHRRFGGGVGELLVEPAAQHAAVGVHRGRQHDASVFRLGADGRPRHFYSVCAMITPTQFRGMDLLTPFWSFLDLTPEGRGEFLPRRSYE